MSKQNLPANVRDRQAYRGYYIIFGSGYWHVSKGGFHITSQATLEHAKQCIDELVEEN